MNHGITAKEQLADVLEHFNVVVSKEDIFSRCKVRSNGRTVISLNTVIPLCGT